MIANDLMDISEQSYVNFRRNYFLRDIIKLFFLIGIAMFLVYFLPTTFYTKIAFLFILPIIYYSKNDFLWLAWFFIIVDAPGLLFKGGLVDDPNRLPIYTIAAGASISFVELVIAVFLLKTLIRKRLKTTIIFKKHFQIFVLLLVFYSIVTILFVEFNIVELVRVVFPWTIVYSSCMLLNEVKTIDRLSNLLFIFVFLVVLTQVYSFISGEHIVNLLKPEMYHIKSHLSREVSEYSTTASRTLYSMFLVFYATIFSIIYIFKRNRVFRKEYLYFVLSFSYLACILSGTRGYLLAISVIIGGSFIVKMRSIKQFFKTILFIVILPILIFFIQFLSPAVSRQLGLVFERFETMLFLFEGDLTAGGTLIRITERIPRIMSVIRESPVFGFGFSTTYFENADSDVGLFTNILNIGFFGITMLYMLFLSLLQRTIYSTKNNSFIAKHGSIGSIFIIGFIGIQVFHFTTNVAFGLAPGANAPIYERYIIYGLILAAINTFVIHSKPEQHEFKNERINWVSLG